jgi:hypothetical protein
MGQVAEVIFFLLSSYFLKLRYKGSIVPLLSRGC